MGGGGDGETTKAHGETIKDVRVGDPPERQEGMRGEEGERGADGRVLEDSRPKKNTWSQEKTDRLTDRQSDMP